MVIVEEITQEAKKIARCDSCMELGHVAAVCRSKSNTKVDQVQGYSTEDFNTNSNLTFVGG